MGCPGYAARSQGSRAGTEVVVSGDELGQIIDRRY